MLALILALVAIPYLPGGMVTSQTNTSTKHIFGMVGAWEPLPPHSQVPNTRGHVFKWDCPRHDPTLGPLRSIDVYVYKRSKRVWRLENLHQTGWDTIHWLYHKDEHTLLEAQIHHWPLYESPWSGFAAGAYSALLSGFDGVLDFAGTSGHTGSAWWPWAFWEKGFEHYTTPLLLQDFTGRGPMPMELTVRTGYWTTSPFMGEVGRLDGLSFVRVVIRLNY